MSDESDAISSPLQMLAARFEAASQRYASEHGIERDDDWFVLKLQEELGELTQAWVEYTSRSRSRGRSAEELERALADEAADVLGHILLFAHRHELNLDTAIARKWRFSP